MKTDDHRDDIAFTERVRSALDAAGVPDDVVDRLGAARRQAVAIADARARIVPLPSRWLPMGAMAATVLAAVLLRGPPNIPAVPFDDDLQLAAVDDLDLLENLEFAAWMVESDAGDAI